MIANNLEKNPWSEAISAECYVINRFMTHPILEKTPYELLKGRKPNISHLRTFGCRCYIYNNGKNNLGKFDARSDEGIFLGYSSHSKAFGVLNKRTKCVEESVDVVFDENCSVFENNMQGDNEIEEHRQEQVEQHVPSVEQSVRIQSGGTVSQDTGQSEEQNDVDNAASSEGLIVKGYKYQGSHPIDHDFIDLTSEMTMRPGLKNL